jgi:predicted DNA-binding transcriptional regulator YafY
MHRIVWIDRQIRELRYPNCTDIAEQFCLSPRQAARDIEYLRDSMCAPLDFCRKNRGYYYTEASFVLGQIMITTQQKQGLAYLADQYEQFNNEHAIHLSKLFRRLIDDAPVDKVELTLPLFPIRSDELTYFDKLQEAILSYRKVDLFYQDELDERTYLRFAPYKLYTYRHSNYVVGYCESTKEVRFVGLHTLVDIAMTEESFDLTPLLKQAFIIPELTPEPEKAIVWLSSDAYAVSLPFGICQISQGTYEIHYYSAEKLLSTLFLLPCRCSVLSPQWLQGKYIHMLERKWRQQMDDTICQSASVTLELPSVRRITTDQGVR